MKTSLLSLAILISLTSFAFAQGNPVLGKWAADEGDGVFVVKVSVTIEPQQVTFSNNCIYQGQSVTATATSPAQVTDKQIITSASSRQDTPIPGTEASCSVEIKPQTFDYSFEGNALILKSGEQATELQRAQ